MNFSTIIAALIITKIASGLFLGDNFSIFDELLWAYLIGSIPFGLILTKITTGKDIRSIGSGNIGATNVLRTGNKKIAALTLALDLMKGYAAVAIFQNTSTHEYIYLIAASVIIGHMYPVWLSFKGGKGIATILGVLLALNWHIAAVSLIIWSATAYLTKYSSLAALVAIISLPFLTYFMSGPEFAIFSLTLGSIIVYKHRENIKRLIKGEETKIGNSTSAVETKNRDQ